MPTGEQLIRLRTALTSLVDQFLKLDEPRQDALFEVLSKLKLTSPLFSTTDEDFVAKNANVPVRTAQAALRLGAAMVDLGPENILHILTDENVERKVVLRNLLERLTPAAQAINSENEQLKRLGRTMPMLDTFSIDCDLRYITGEEDDEYSLAPIAIVRISTDESDHDLIFQCNEAALQRISTVAKDALARLAQLTRLAKQGAEQNKD